MLVNIVKMFGRYSGKLLIVILSCQTLLLPSILSPYFDNSVPLP